MQDRKLDVLIARFPYGGNGGMSAEHPDVGTWLMDTAIKAKADPRIGRFATHTWSDTPITMTRNRAVLDARRWGYDLLVMIDSDMSPDYHPDRYGAKPFWDSSFEFVYKHYEKGPSVIAAPYCGPPPTKGIGFSNVYVFDWESQSDEDSDRFNYRLSQISRMDAASRLGIHPVAALPTGLIIFDMRIFDVIEPEDNGSNTAQQGWFYYEWEDKYAANKASTEDVTATRDMSLIGQRKLGYNPVFCNFDAWAGHNKNWCVEAPSPVPVEEVGAKLARAVETGFTKLERRGYVIPGIQNVQEQKVPQAAPDRVDRHAQRRDEAVPAVRSGAEVERVREGDGQSGRPDKELQAVPSGDKGAAECEPQGVEGGPLCNAENNGCCHGD